MFVMSLDMLLYIGENIIQAVSTKLQVIFLCSPDSIFQPPSGSIYIRVVIFWMCIKCSMRRSRLGSATRRCAVQPVVVLSTAISYTNLVSSLTVRSSLIHWHVENQLFCEWLCPSIPWRLVLSDYKHPIQPHLLSRAMGRAEIVGIAARANTVQIWRWVNDGAPHHFNLSRNLQYNSHGWRRFVTGSNTIGLIHQRIQHSYRSSHQSYFISRM